jgi:hypothetical protein
MKYLITLTMILTSLHVAAASSEILRCLGVEEQRLHKAKSQGPDYQLNQQLISELVQVQNVDLAPQFLKQVCGPKVVSPSKKFLYLLLDNGKSIFEFRNGISGLEKSIGDSMLDDFMVASQQLVLGYIATIQQESPTADCLKKNIPQLDLLYVDMKYLEEEIETKYLFKKKGLAEKILNKLANYPALFKKCSPQEKVKKTDKSGSSAKRKKS